MDYASVVDGIAQGITVRRHSSADELTKFKERKISEVADKRTSEISHKLSTAFRDSINDLVKSIITYNVNNNGLVIRGKRDNVALSKYGIKVLMNRSIDLFTAGRLSAYQFSDDYNRVSEINGIPEVPGNEIECMVERSEFDSLSGWYSKELEITPSSFSVNEKYISVIVDKAFTVYPNLELDNHTIINDNQYLYGYLLSLFNSCSDYLRVIYSAQGYNKYPVFCTMISEEKTIHPNKTFLQIGYSETYIQEWMDIDKLTFYLANKLSVPANSLTRNEMVELLVGFKNLNELIIKHFAAFNEKCDSRLLTISSLDNMSYSDAINKVQGSIGNIEINAFILHSLLNEIRVQYEDLRKGILVSKGGHV